MYFTKIQIFFAMLITSILLPLGVIMGLMLLGSNRVYIGVYFSFCLVGYLLFYVLYKCNSWEFTFLKLKWFPFIAMTSVVIYEVYKEGSSYFIHRYDGWLEGSSILLIFFIGRCIYKIHKASKKPSNALKLAFPFEKGKYLITDGGDGATSALVNYHYKSSTHSQHKTQQSMRYAVDIVKLGPWSRSIGRWIAISRNTDYYIYQESILSPVDGNVVKFNDGVINNDPFPGKGKMPYNLGNYVVIKKENYYIIMGHMKKGSICVKQGEAVRKGDIIGQIGNAGLTPRPHLHLQVSKCEDGDYWGAEGVPVVFNEDFYPVKNSVIQV